MTDLGVGLHVLLILWLIPWSVLTGSSSPRAASLQASRADTRQKLPPQSWICPMHPDVVEEKPGICPICKMDLEPVRLESAWSCPVHTTVVEAHEGQCPICKRRLVPVTVSVFWTCPGPAVHEMSPGRCPDGSDRVVAHERRPHGDHNPRHGGIFFMAPDNWHHLEGTYPRAGVFRVFLYDDYTRQLPLAAVNGRAVTNAESFALQPSKDGAYLEARIPSLPLPAEIAAKIRFNTAGEEYHFDFIFPSYSKEPIHGSRPVTTTAARGGSSQDLQKRPGTAIGAAPTADVPDMTTTGLLTQLSTERREVETLLLQGAFTQVYVPAMSAKDLALALETHSGEVPGDRQRRVASAVRRVVLAAWLLDLYGDLGDREKLTDAYHSFAAAVQDLTAAYAKGP